MARHKIRVRLSLLITSVAYPQLIYCLGQTSSTLLSVLGDDFSDSQTLVGSGFTQTSGSLSSAGYASPLIRATTFEGKPVFIRKKVQVDRGKKVFNHLNLHVDGPSPDGALENDHHGQSYGPPRRSAPPANG